MTTKPRKGAPLAKSRVEAARDGSGVPVFAIAVGALVLVLVIAGVIIAVGGGDHDGPGDTTAAGEEAIDAGDQAFGPVTATGTPLPERPDSGDDPAVGMDAPKLEGETPSGEPITIDPADGPMVIAFLAHWCPHCQAEVPRIVELADGTGEIEGVPFVAVLTGTAAEAPNFPPGAWLAREGWPAGAMLDTEPENDGAGLPVAYSTYGVAGYPFLVAIDADGKVAARSSGELGDDGLRDFFAQVAE